MTIYKVVLNGQCQGQDIKNILYYRTGFEIDISGLTAGGTVECAQAVKSMVWPLLKAVLPVSFEMQDISCYVYDSQDFHLMYQNPTILGVQENGLRAGSLNGPAPCAILRFSLEPHIILVDGPKPPKRGYLAVGPMIDEWIQDSGEMLLGTVEQLEWDLVCAALSNNIGTILPPSNFFPIRVHQDKVLGLWKITSFADVRDCSIRTGSSFRRSRMPES